MNKIIIENVELNILLVMYDNVGGFGPNHCYRSREIGDMCEIDLNNFSREVSFLVEHGLLGIKQDEYEQQRKEYQKEIDSLAPSVAKQKKRGWDGDGYIPHNYGWKPAVDDGEPDYVAKARELQRFKQSLPYRTYFVTGLGANYVRLVRQKVEAKFRPKKGERENGLKEMPAKAGAYVKRALELSSQVVIGIASNVLASLISGKP